jgi:cytidine deaminase
MAAITDAARRGVPIEGATLYCTTFPCHLCARHIIGTGLKRVVYIEPYPKSAAEDLYQDSMIVDPEGPMIDHVSFDPFVGIAPIVYPFMFRVDDIRKKSDGSASKWGTDLKREPRLRRFVLAYVMTEEFVLGRVIPETFVGDYAII